MGGLKGFVRSHQLIAFFVLAYAITWAVWIPAHSMKYAGLISAWGAFGPALAGVAVTRLVNPRHSDTNRLVPLLAFLIGLVVSAMIFALVVWMRMRPPWSSEIVASVVLQGLVSAIAPALVVSSAFSGNEATKEYLQSLVKPRGSGVHYLFALLVFPFTFWLGFLISEAIGRAPFWSLPPLRGWESGLFVAVAFITQFFYGNGLGEEPGWRGFALPRLQARYSPLIAGLVIALFWFPWHLPLKVMNPDNLSYLVYGLGFVPQSILLVWLFNRTKGSILAVGIAHASYNVAGKYMFPPTFAMLILQFILVTILILIDRMWERNAPGNSAVLRLTEQELTVR